MDKYILFLESNYDSNQTFYINQPYCPDYNKLVVYDDDEFIHDPYGFYSHKKVFYDEKTYGTPFYEDYPISTYRFKDI